MLITVSISLLLYRVYIYIYYYYIIISFIIITSFTKVFKQEFLKEMAAKYSAYNVTELHFYSYIK